MHHHICTCPRWKQKFVFEDESFLHENHISNYGLSFDGALLRKPSGKGKRVVISGAITEDGWLGLDYVNSKFEGNMEDVYEEGSIKYWQANVGNADCHKNFDADVFINYFK